MPKTITLSDNTYAELQYVLGVAPVPTPVPVPVPTPTQSTYPVAKLTEADKVYLCLMQAPYRSALKSVPGSHQLFFDVLTDAQGRVWTEGNDALKLAINRVINEASGSTLLYSFNMSAYAGPLKAVVQNAISTRLL